MKTKVALVIPYFGKIPDYFELWAESANRNPDFDFLIFTDLPFNIEKYDNIKTISISFDELKDLISKKLNMRIKLSNPYKLCDYKPTYGYILSDYLADYDFWGFCDMDLIFGDLSHFINDELLSKYDKILYSGHFTLQRNNDKINKIFMQKFKNVMNYKFAYSTNFDCHFDENGTLAYCNEYDKSIRFYFKWIFFEADFNSYQFTAHNSECCALWDNGILTLYWNNGADSEETMYIHLQKRQMFKKFDNVKDKFIILRDEFIEYDQKDISYYLQIPVDNEKKKAFDKRISDRLRQIKINKLKKGHIIVKFNSIIHKWRNQKDLHSS